MAQLVNNIHLQQSGTRGVEELALQHLAGDDPLIQQLPVELQKYVHRPDDHKGQLVFVNRSSIASFCHCAIASLFCCWSICRCHLVKQGEIALTQNGPIPEILPPGRHVLLSPLNEWRGTRDFRSKVINHGPLHIIRVEMGQLGYAVNMDDGKPMLLSRGQHIINSLSFLWKKFVNLSETETTLEKLSIIRIETGSVGYAFKKGNLVILSPGLHLIVPPDRFADILSTQIQILDLPLGIHETSDYVALAIKAAVFYRICQPEKTLKRLKNIKQQILETAVATLAGIIRASSMSDLGSRSQPFYHQERKNSTNEKKEEKEEKEDEKNNDNKDFSHQRPFFQFVHDEFIQQLHDHVLEEWGIEIQNIRIEQLKINDPQLQKNISNNAIDVSKQHNKYIMLQKQQEIMMVEANTNASKLQIQTNAKASTIRAIALAEADAELIIAQAEKESLELKGQGESQYSQLLESTKLGNKLSLLKLQADAIKGIKQICYIPSMNSLLDSRQLFAQNKLLPNAKPNDNELLL